MSSNEKLILILINAHLYLLVWALNSFSKEQLFRFTLFTWYWWARSKIHTSFYKYFRSAWPVLSSKGCSDFGPGANSAASTIFFSVLRRLCLASMLLLCNYSEKISNLNQQFRTYIYTLLATNVLVTILSAMVNWISIFSEAILPGNTVLQCAVWNSSTQTYIFKFYIVTLCCSV